MTPEELTDRFPRLYHMAEDGSWPSIAARGLLSTSALLDLYGIEGAERDTIERQRRRDKVRLDDPILGPVIIRDQKPLPESRLATCLEDGLTPADWYSTLNGRVFFWLTETRLETLLAARAYRSEPQTVLIVDTAEVIARYASEVELSPINSGAVMPIARPRGRSTFLPIKEYERPNVAELCVLRAIPDIAELVIRVERRSPTGDRTVLFARS
jgi:hypothetical protein